MPTCPRCTNELSRKQVNNHRKYGCSRRDEIAIAARSNVPGPLSIADTMLQNLAAFSSDPRRLLIENQPKGVFVFFFSSGVIIDTSVQ